jgi:hypothetical protein
MDLRPPVTAAILSGQTTRSEGKRKLFWIVDFFFFFFKVSASTLSSTFSNLMHVLPPLFSFVELTFRQYQMAR